MSEAPRRASASAASRPIPEVAPVMRQVLPRMAPSAQPANRRTIARFRANAKPVPVTGPRCGLTKRRKDAALGSGWGCKPRLFRSSLADAAGAGESPALDASEHLGDDR